MRLLCYACPRCRKVSRGISEQASRRSRRGSTDHLPRPHAGGVVALDDADRHRSLASAYPSVALPSAYAIYRSRLLAAAVEPFLGATQALPAIAIAPILVLWVGYGFVAIVVLCALMVFFPILVSTVVGLRHIDRELLEAAALDGATGWSMAWHMELPLAAPAILGGLRNGFALSVTGAVVGEMVMGGTGLGQVLTQMRNNVDTAGMFVIIIILCTMATLLYTIVYRIERSKRYDITQ